MSLSFIRIIVYVSSYLGFFFFHFLFYFTAKWFYNNHETGWLQQRTAYGQTNAYLEAVSREKHSGNYTCYAENSLGTDSISYEVHVQGNLTLY